MPCTGQAQSQRPAPLVLLGCLAVPVESASSKHRWDARSQFSTKHRMCCQQMSPKRRRAACGELHTTNVAICNALGATAANSIHCSTNRGKVVPDAAATARPSVQHTDLCTLAEHQPRTGMTPSAHPIAGVETDPVLHCLVHLREPARRRCIQLRRKYLEQLVGQRDEPHTLRRPQPWCRWWWGVTVGPHPAMLQPLGVCCLVL